MRILSTKNFLIGSLAALSFVLAGCLTKSDDDEDPIVLQALAITAQPQNVTVAIGDSATVSVTAVSDHGPISYMWIATFPGGADTLNDSTSTIKFLASGDFTGATLKVVVSDTTDTTITSNAVTITVTYAAQGDTLTLGGQAHLTLGSVIDLDSGKVWTSLVANANQAKIDLVYLYYNNTATLNGALAAKDSGTKYGINLTNSYNASLVKNIRLVKVTAKPSSIHAADSLWNAGVKLRSTVIATGDKFVVESSEEVYQYLEVRSVSGTTAGTAGLTLFAGEIEDD